MPTQVQPCDSVSGHMSLKTHMHLMYMFLIILINGRNNKNKNISDICTYYWSYNAFIYPDSKIWIKCLYI